MRSSDSHTSPRSFRSVRYVLLAAFAAAMIFGYRGLPEASASSDSVPIAAATTVSTEPEAYALTREMLDLALNLRSVSEFTAFAERGIALNGVAEIKGSSGDGSRSVRGRKASRDLGNAIDAVRQLPCEKNADAELGAKTFAAGVHCFDRAELNGEMVIDGGGTTSGIYLFRVAGHLSINDAAAIIPINGAQAGNVFFIADSVEIGADAMLRASLFSINDIRAARGSIVTEKVLALGSIELDGSKVLGGSTGSMRICAAQPLPVSAANSLSNRVFHFTVTGAASIGTSANPVRVSTGLCSKPFDVTAGPQTVTELNSGTLVTPADGTFQGNFELVDVSNTTPSSRSSLGLINLATRAAAVNVVSGDVSNMISLRFTNRRAITAFLEVCKKRASGPGTSNPSGPEPLAGGDQDVFGFFQYTISGVYAINQQNPNLKTLQIFTIPAGQCTGPISVTRGDPAPFDTGSTSTLATVSELPRVGTYFESAEVIPAARRASADVPGTIIGVDPNGTATSISAPGGGYVNAVLVEGGDSTNQTMAVFTNRSNPTRIKVCAIAGPGIPLNTLMRFTVSGIGALSATHPQSSEYGNVVRTVDVRAGDPAQGGTCEFVPGTGANLPNYDQFQTFVNGTPVTVIQNGISPDNTVAQNGGQLRASQIRVFASTLASTGVAGFSPNPDIVPSGDRVARAVVIARATIPEIEFSDFRFNPTVLKVCQIGLGDAVGLEANYAVALVSPQIGGANPGPMFPAFSTNVTVIAGAGSNGEGNCVFVNGSALTGGAINQGSTMTVTQVTGLPPLVLDSIACPSCGAGGLTADLPLRRATLSGPNGFAAGINSVVFTNRKQTVVCRQSPLDAEISTAERPGCFRLQRFDFDGDAKADPAVYNPSTGAWSIRQSAEGNGISNRMFGEIGDIPIPADFDGDSRSDLAVFRPSNGRWYFQGSTNVFEYHQWGQAGDIPQPGDFNGDGKADFIVFRPANATWYIKTTNGEFATVQFGLATDTPLLADYDGDGRMDIGVFRDGTWYTLESQRGFRVTSFGQAGDVPVPGDYDGDGSSDLAVFRSGTWYILTATTYTVTQAGNAGDIPVPADYDGDGKLDRAVYRRAEGRWYIRYSAGSTTVNPIDLGGPDYLPVEAPVSFLMN